MAEPNLIDLIAGINLSYEEDGREKKKTQANLLLEIAEGIPLFHNQFNDAFARITRGSHIEVTRVESSDFRDFLSLCYYELCGAAANRASLRDAIGTLNAKARYASPKWPTFQRVAKFKGNLYIDLCDEHWRCIEITPDRWNVIETPPYGFWFERGKNATALPDPSRGGSVELLRDFITVQDSRWPALRGFIWNSFQANGPYFLLALQGQQGTAKTTATKLLKSVIDPSSIPVLTPPRDIQSLIIISKDSWLPCFDNLSRINAELSDALCRLSTGGGFSTRKLYTDDEQHSVNVQRPVILNGINDLATRPDLSERCISLELERIPAESRLTEAELWERFTSVKGEILGGICDGLVAGLRHSDVELAQKPRMAEPALWATRCDHSIPNARGSFMSAYLKTQNEQTLNALETSDVCATLMAFMTTHQKWKGTPSELYGILSDRIDRETGRSKYWPQSANAMTRTLRGRYGKSLYDVGLEVETWNSGGRKIAITKDLHRWNNTVQPVHIESTNQQQPT